MTFLKLFCKIAVKIKYSNNSALIGILKSEKDESIKFIIYSSVSLNTDKIWRYLVKFFVFKMKFLFMTKSSVIFFNNEAVYLAVCNRCSENINLLEKLYLVLLLKDFEIL